MEAQQPLVSGLWALAHLYKMLRDDCPPATNVSKDIFLGNGQRSFLEACWPLISGLWALAHLYEMLCYDRCPAVTQAINALEDVFLRNGQGPSAEA